MPRSHFHVNLSGKINTRKVLRNGMRWGYLVAVTGSTWQLRGLCGNYGVYVANEDEYGVNVDVTERLPLTPRNSHVLGVIIIIFSFSS